MRTIYFNAIIIALAAGGMIFVSPLKVVQAYAPSKADLMKLYQNGTLLIPFSRKDSC